MILSQAITFFFVVMTVIVTSTRATCPSDGQYLSLGYDDLFAIATEDTVNGCYIQLVPEDVLPCYLYVKTPTGRGPHRNGWPKFSSGMKSDGCVKAPYFPKGVGDCPYESTDFALSSTFLDSICTDDGVLNAVSQLKDAIRNGACNQCAPFHNYEDC